jgi:hypothetical protein
LGLAEVERQAALDRKRFNQREAENHQIASQEAMKSRAEYEARIQEALAHVATVNPARVWENAGTFGSAMGLISAGVGGYLAAMQGGGPNHALEYISKLVDQDIGAQKFDIETQKEAVYRAENAAERNERSVADRFRRMEEERAFRYQSLIEESKAQAAMFQSPIMQAKYMKTIGGLVGQQAQSLENASNLRYERRYREAKDILEAGQRQEEIAKEWYNARTSRMGEERLARASTGEPIDESGFLRDPTTNEVVIGKDGKPSIITGTDAQKGDFQLKVSGTFSSLDKLKELRQLQAEIGSAVPWGKMTSDQQRRLSSIYNDLLTDMAYAKSGASYTDRQLEQLKTIIPLETLITADTDKALVSYMNGVKTKLKFDVNSRTTGGWPALEEAIDKRLGPLPSAPKKTEVSSFDVVGGLKALGAPGSEGLITIDTVREHKLALKEIERKIKENFSGYPLQQAADAVSAALDASERVSPGAGAALREAAMDLADTIRFAQGARNSAQGLPPPPRELLRSGGE